METKTLKELSSAIEQTIIEPATLMSEFERSLSQSALEALAPGYAAAEEAWEECLKGLLKNGLAFEVEEKAGFLLDRRCQLVWAFAFFSALKVAGHNDAEIARISKLFGVGGSSKPAIG